MAGQSSNSANHCNTYCRIARAERNAGSEINILTDDKGCVTSTFYELTYRYATNDAQACPLVQVMAGQTGLIENYDTGSFLVRPDSKTLTSFKGNQYYRKTTMTGCSSGNSKFYNLFFYRD
jgi:hypothetical protein